MHLSKAKITASGLLPALFRNEAERRLRKISTHTHKKALDTHIHIVHTHTYTFPFCRKHDMCVALKCA